MYLKLFNKELVENLFELKEGLNECTSFINDQSLYNGMHFNTPENIFSNISFNKKMTFCKISQVELEFDSTVVHLQNDMKTNALVISKIRDFGDCETVKWLLEDCHVQHIENMIEVIIKDACRKDNLDTIQYVLDNICKDDTVLHYIEYYSGLYKKGDIQSFVATIK